MHEVLKYRHALPGLFLLFLHIKEIKESHDYHLYTKPRTTF